MSEHGAQDDRRCSVRQNRVVLAPVAGVKLSVANSIQPDRFSHQAGSDGGKTNSSPGRARHKPSNHCAGNAGVLRLYLYARVRISLALFAHETAGAASTRHSLLPLRLRERNFSKPRAQCVARMQTHVQSTHTSSSPAKAGRSSIPEAAVIESRSRGVLDTRLRGYDIWFGAAIVLRYPCGVTDILAQSRRPISTQSWVLRRSAMLTASQMPMAVSATVNASAATLASMR